MKYEVMAGGLFGLAMVLAGCGAQGGTPQT